MREFKDQGNCTQNKEFFNPSASWNFQEDVLKCNGEEPIMDNAILAKSINLLVHE
jgi:hypothetical protein